MFLSVLSLRRFPIGASSSARPSRWRCLSRPPSVSNRRASHSSEATRFAFAVWRRSRTECRSASATAGRKIMHSSTRIRSMKCGRTCIPTEASLPFVTSTSRRFTRAPSRIRWRPFPTAFTSTLWTWRQWVSVPKIRHTELGGWRRRRARQC